MATTREYDPGVVKSTIVGGSSQAAFSVSIAQSNRPFGSIGSGGSAAGVELEIIVGDWCWHFGHAGGVFNAAMGLAANL